jgi:hypothetical protein
MHGVTAILDGRFAAYYLWKVSFAVWISWMNNPVALFFTVPYELPQ